MLIKYTFIVIKKDLMIAIQTCDKFYYICKVNYLVNSNT